MAIAQSELLPQPKTMTYEDYLAEPTVYGRYDIIDGVRRVVGTTEEHQDIVLNLAEILRVYQRTMQTGKVIVAPHDVLISRIPLRTRQPDVMFISNARHAQNPPRSSPIPMTTAPEMVVEVISDSEKNHVLAAKIRDYQRLNVLEAWVARPVEQTVEVLSLTPTTVTSVATYHAGQHVQSVAFPDLVVAVDDIFAE